MDDLEINNIHSRIIIEFGFPESEVLDFTDPEKALIFLKSGNFNPEYLSTILFLDINMPIISGWEFLETFDLFDAKVKDAICIFMLSSSIDPRDHKRALGNKNVVSYFEKPLSEENVILAAGHLINKSFL